MDTLTKEERSWNMSRIRGRTREVVECEGVGGDRPAADGGGGRELELRDLGTRGMCWAGED
jgi:hypothetical protein